MPPDAPLDARAIALGLERLAHADTNQFVALARLTGLDPARDFRHLDLSFIDLRGEDLTPFNLSHAVFKGARVAGTKFGPSVSRQQLAQANWSTGGVVIALGRMAVRSAQRALQNAHGSALVVRRFDDSRSLYVVTHSDGVSRTVRSLAEAVGDAEYVVLVFGEQEQPVLNIDEFTAVLSTKRLVLGLQIETGGMGLAMEYSASLAAICACKAKVAGFNQIDEKGAAYIEDGIATWVKIVESIPGADRASRVSEGVLIGGDATLLPSTEVSSPPHAERVFAEISRLAQREGRALLNFVPSRDAYFDANTVRAALNATAIRAEVSQAGPPAEAGALWGVWIASPPAKAKADWRIRPSIPSAAPPIKRSKEVIKRPSLMELAIAKLDNTSSDVLVKLSGLGALQREDRADGRPFRKALEIARDVGVTTQALAAAASTSSDRIARWRDGTMLPKVKIRLSLIMEVMRLAEAELKAQPTRK